TIFWFSAVIAAQAAFISSSVRMVVIVSSVKNGPITVGSSNGCSLSAWVVSCTAGSAVVDDCAYAAPPMDVTARAAVANFSFMGRSFPVHKVIETDRVSRTDQEERGSCRQFGVNPK